MIKVEPIITEKSNNQSQFKQFTFKVSGDSNKIELAKVLQELTGVEVEKIRVLNVRGKERLVGRGRVMTKRKPFKKAIVTFKDTIDLNQLQEKQTNK